MPEEKEQQQPKKQVLTKEQEALLELYLKRLDEFSDSIKEIEKVQVEIETLHLKRILTK